MAWPEMERAGAVNADPIIHHQNSNPRHSAGGPETQIGQIPVAVVRRFGFCHAIYKIEGRQITNLGLFDDTGFARDVAISLNEKFEEAS